jgi:hypothetical protein
MTDAMSLSTYQLLDREAVAEVQYLKAIERHFIDYLAERYKNGGGIEIADLCDKRLDQSGRLLGRVRDKARGIKGWEPRDPVGCPADERGEA